VEDEEELERLLREFGFAPSDGRDGEQAPPRSDDLNDEDW
jgi:hypothetical protein